MEWRLTVTCLLLSHSLDHHIFWILYEPPMERIIWWLLLDLDLKAGNLPSSQRIKSLTSYSGPSLPDVLFFFCPDGRQGPEGRPGPLGEPPAVAGGAAPRLGAAR